eukprot:6395171-Amphidinium_carterae.1
MRKVCPPVLLDHKRDCLLFYRGIGLILCKVSEGDRIVAVRGKTAHALVEAFLEAMQDREDLKLTIQKKGSVVVHIQ